jgi:tetratricopeptide (TPR) repeat protein
MTTAAPDPQASNPEQARSPAASWMRIGDEHHNAGRNEAAIDAYRCGLAVIAGEAVARTPAETAAELHARLGNACLKGGDLESAAENYKAALRLKADLSSCWCNLGNILVRTGKAQDAIAYYLQALKISPAHWASRTNLVQALMATKQFVIARALIEELIAERPEDATLHHQLGKVQFELDDVQAAMASFGLALLLNPGDADSLYWIGGIRQRLGDDEAAYAAYARAAQIQPLIRRPAVKSPADFRVLALYAPFGGNTPTEYLFKHAAYDTDTLALFEQNHYDAETFSEGVDIVVNLLSDVDQAARVLPLAAALADRLGRPVVNHPRKILRTTRDATAELLTGIEGCRIPKILRQEQGSTLSVEDIRAAFPPASSILARPVGTHGGDDFDKLDGTDELAAYVDGPAATDRYFIEYADYGSADGHFRKYRFIFVGGEVLPYHLAVGNDWKVHHVSTDMANQEWMRREEAAFLNDPTLVFNPCHYRALREIQQRIGLDYFGIDCSIDASGDLLVFEVNASMLVHDDNAEFPYKDPAVRRIKAAFDAMLAKFARVSV